jgi:uncharacterized protein
MNNRQQLFESIKQEVFQLLKEKLPNHLYYHCLGHTEDVVRESARIAKAEQLSNQETLLVLLAAVFHDTGFIQSPKDHEARSCDIAREMLKHFPLTDEELDMICETIMATKIPQAPKSKIAEVICDADLDYLGRTDYDEISERLFQEIKQTNPDFTQSEWIKLQDNFLKAHHYFTATSQLERNEIKAINHQRVINQIN